MNSLWDIIKASLQIHYSKEAGKISNLWDTCCAIVVNEVCHGIVVYDNW